MVPNIHIYEKLMFERQRELERTLEQRRMLSSMPRHSLLQRMAGKLGGILMAVGSSLQQIELRHKPVMSDL